MPQILLDSPPKLLNVHSTRPNAMANNPSCPVP